MSIQGSQIVFDGVEASAALRDSIEQSLNALHEHAPQLRSCRVVVAAPHRHQHKGRRYRVVLDAAFASHVLVVDGSGNDDPRHDDPYIAVRDAFAALRRRIDSVVGAERGRSPHDP